MHFFAHDLRKQETKGTCRPDDSRAVGSRESQSWTELSAVIRRIEDAVEQQLARVCGAGEGSERGDMGGGGGCGQHVLAATYRGPSIWPFVVSTPQIHSLILLF
jgi:hypothetical protein